MDLRLALTIASLLASLLAAYSSASAQTAAIESGATSGYTGRKAPVSSVGGYGGDTSGYAAKTNPYAGFTSVETDYGGGGVHTAAPNSPILATPLPKKRVKVDGAGHTWTWDESLGVWRDPSTNAMRYMEPQ